MIIGVEGSVRKLGGSRVWRWTRELVANLPARADLVLQALRSLRSRALKKPSAYQAGSSRRLRAIGSKVGSFSAVSKPIFATKYSFCSIFRDLLHFFAGIPDFAQLLFCKIQRQLPKFRSKEQILRFFREISTKICRNFVERLRFLENSRKCN